MNATLTKAGNSTAKRFSFTVKKTVAAIVAAEVNVSEGEQEVVIDATNGATVETIAISSDVPDDQPVVVNFESVLNTSGAAPTITVSTNLTMSRETSVANYSVELSSGTVVTGPEDWNGLISIPTVQEITDFVAPVVSGKTTEVDAVVEVGVLGVRLNFTAPVKLVLSGMTGKKAAFSFEGSQLTKITTQCANATDYTGIPTAGECYFDDSTDLIVWTYHFTRFSAYTETDVVAAVDDDDITFDSNVTVITIPTKSVVWSTVNAGETKTLTIDNSDIFADSIDVEFISDITNAKLTVKQVTEPANTKEGTVYAYLEITKENFENSDISSASIKFRVANSWLDDNSISKEDIALFRYTTQWDELETVIEREDDSNAYYTATTSGFSTFAIAPREVVPEVVEEVPEVEPVPEEEVPPEEPEEEEVPPSRVNILWLNILWLIAAIVVIVFIYVFWKEGKRRRGSKGNGKELEDYIKKRTNKGTSQDEMKKSLLDVGWSEEKVDAALKKFEKK
ncbi:MAG: PGF-pre-PGF domain-containing protein [Nanoarchaeota archaeon]|nr:PGF-pre-PGF domain-containing protein [DPANN group archaeon]MBL7116277.1 PGF-pre-PGF domain-containing protein [Nanoarchaeota archaeon]